VSEKLTIKLKGAEAVRTIGREISTKKNDISFVELGLILDASMRTMHKKLQNNVSIFAKIKAIDLLKLTDPDDFAMLTYCFI